MRIYTTLIGMLHGLFTVGVVNGYENNHPFSYNEENIERRLQGPKGFDIVFMVDESGSMSNEQAKFESHVPTIFNTLDALALDPPSTVGLVGFGGSGIFHHLEGHVHTPLTANQTTFLDAVNNLTLDGGLEPSCETICKAIEGDLDQDLDFRLGQTFGIVLISDEPSSSYNPNYNMDRVVSSMNNIPPGNEANAKGIFYGIVPLGKATDSYKPIAEATGGGLYSRAEFRSDPDMVLKDIIAKLNAAVNPLPSPIIHVEPDHAMLIAGNTHQLNVTLSGASGNFAGRTVWLEVLYGPHQGLNESAIANAAGVATINITGAAGALGKDIYEVCFVVGGTECGNLVSARWISPEPIARIPPEARATIVIVPKNVTCETGAPHELTATVTRGIVPLEGIQVKFRVSSGPNKGVSGANVTNEFGEATWTYSNNDVAGICPTYRACIKDEGVKKRCRFSGAVLTPTPPSFDPLTAKCINCNSLGTSTPFPTAKTFTATTADSCGPLTVTVTGKDCFRLSRGGLHKYKSSTCVASLDGPSITLGTQCKNGDHVEWPVKAVNAAGQEATKMCHMIFSGARRLPQTYLRPTS